MTWWDKFKKQEEEEEHILKRKSSILKKKIEKNEPYSRFQIKLED